VVKEDPRSLTYTMVPRKKRKKGTRPAEGEETVWKEVANGESSGPLALGKGEPRKTGYLPESAAFGEKNQRSKQKKRGG